MARSIQLTIHESQQELEQCLSNRRSAMSKDGCKCFGDYLIDLDAVPQALDEEMALTF